MHLPVHRSLKLACCCSSSSADIVIYPLPEGHSRRAPQQRTARTRRIGQTPAAELINTAPPVEPPRHPVKQQSAIRRTPSAASSLSVGPGYGVAPKRDDLPPAVNEALLYPTKQQPQQHRTTKGTQNSRLAKPKTQQLTEHTPKQRIGRQSSQKQPGDTQQLRQRRRDIPYDPGRAFMQAGMPSGLWVLPLGAKSEAPPAPPPVAPEDPAELLKLSAVLHVECAVHITPTRRTNQYSHLMWEALDVQTSRHGVTCSMQ
eukprot:GHUV01025447.1.p1 GENE.GHUV01025447.1~~GHUV01025447.1.p1  ORF type:complete len:258 (+),score=52.68 GHUV01025447.1:299-1072(+)